MTISVKTTHYSITIDCGECGRSGDRHERVSVTDRENRLHGSITHLVNLGWYVDQLSCVVLCPKCVEKRRSMRRKAIVPVGHG